MKRLKLRLTESVTAPSTCLPQVNLLPALTGEIDDIAVAYTMNS